MSDVKMSLPLNEMLCPFCGQGNQCGVAVGDAACWCFSAPVPPALVDLVPRESRRKSCICASCIADFQRDAEAFKSRYAL